MAQAIAETIREAVDPPPKPDDIVTRSLLQAELAVLETRLQTTLHAQTRWVAMFGLALAALVIAADRGHHGGAGLGRASAARMPRIALSR